MFWVLVLAASILLVAVGVPFVLTRSRRPYRRLPEAIEIELHHLAVVRQIHLATDQALRQMLDEVDQYRPHGGAR